MHTLQAHDVYNLLDASLTELASVVLHALFPVAFDIRGLDVEPVLID